jgi:hypothetical protein
MASFLHQAGILSKWILYVFSGHEECLYGELEQMLMLLSCDVLYRFLDAVLNRFI